MPEHPMAAPLLVPRSGLRGRLRRGDLSIGSWLCYGFTPTAELMARLGYEFLVIDMEHTAIGTEMAQELIRVVDLAGSIPLVRVGDNDPLLIKRSMDAGACGVIVPMVNTPAEAEKAATAVRYPPRGSRGVGLARAQGYGISFNEYARWCEEEALVIVQIEHIEAVRNLEAILAVPDVDAFIIGPYDLSASLGKPGRFDDPEVVAALRRVEETMRSSGRCGGVHIVHSDEARLRASIEAGYRFIAYGCDMVFFSEKVLEGRSAVTRAGAMNRDV